MKNFYCLGLFLFAISASAESGTHIFGGTKVQSDDPVASTTVLVTGGKLMGYICTGSIIEQDIVITAAHCVVDASSKSIRIIFAQDVGFSYLTNRPKLPDSDPRVHQVYGAIANPDYRKTGDDRNDIAVIRFKGELPSGYHPAKVISPEVPLIAGEEAILAGYGNSNPYVQGSGGGQLRKATVTIEQMLGASEVVVDQSKGQGSCWGDSGGPAFVQSASDLLLWGLTDRGYPDTSSTCNHAAVYTLLNSFSDFVAGAEASLRQEN